MRASGGFMGQLYTVSYSVLVHVAWGLFKGAMEDVKGQEEAVRG